MEEEESYTGLKRGGTSQEQGLERTKARTLKETVVQELLIVQNGGSKDLAIGKSTFFIFFFKMMTDGLNLLDYEHTLDANLGWNQGRGSGS